METVEIGRIGENIARKYLTAKGYKVVDQNYKTPYLEIDLIATHRGVLVFVEVRTKIGKDFGSPEETLDKRKMKKLIKNVNTYVVINKYNGACRIDAICIVLNEDLSQNRLNHYENITG
ncbi:MAG: YraN family protein [Candidatus Omnitrophota bacterium]